MRYLKGETFGQRYDIDPTGLVLWLDQSDARSYGDVANWYDLSGQGNHAVQAVGGSQAPITGAVGLAGSCRTFDGVADFVEEANANTFDFERNEAFSISMWIKPNAARAGAVGYILMAKFDWDGGAGKGWDLETTWDDVVANKNVLRFWLINDWGAGNRIGVYGSTDLTNDPWWHVVMTYDGSSDAGGVNLYVNSVLENMNTQINGLNATIKNGWKVRIAARGGGVYYPGSIANSCIFSRELTAAEIQRMYLVDKPRYGGL